MTGTQFAKRVNVILNLLTKAKDDLETLAEEQVVSEKSSKILYRCGEKLGAASSKAFNLHANMR